jgi:hypothetical protein
MIVLLPDTEGFMTAGGSGPHNEDGLNTVRVSEEGRGGSDLAGASRGRIHPHTPKAPLKSHGIRVLP